MPRAREKRLDVLGTIQIHGEARERELLQRHAEAQRVFAMTRGAVLAEGAGHDVVGRAQERRGAAVARRHQHHAARTEGIARENQRAYVGRRDARYVAQHDEQRVCSLRGELGARRREARIEAVVVA